jgi:hypothetical protein
MLAAAGFIDLDQENPQSNRMAADFMPKANSQMGIAARGDSDRQRT